MAESDTHEASRAGVFVPWWAMGIAVLVLLGAAGVGIGLRHGGGSSTPKIAAHPSKSTITLTGAVELDNGTSGFDDTHYTASGSGCSGSGGYSDLTDGTSITVYDNSGSVIAVGGLGAGVDAGSACGFPWSVSNVPKSPFYKVEISHRGQLTYSYAQAIAGGLDSSIGGT